MFLNVFDFFWTGMNFLEPKTETDQEGLSMS